MGFRGSRGTNRDVGRTVDFTVDAVRPSAKLAAFDVRSAES